MNERTNNKFYRQQGSRSVGAQLTISTSGFYRRAKFGWNLRCYACRVLSPLIGIHVARRRAVM